MRTTTDAVWQWAMDALLRTRATSFIGSTFGIANNDNNEDNRAKEEMGGAGGVPGGILSTTHDAKKLIGHAIFYGHFCMTGKRPG